jgi:hypothetical protein
VRVSWGEWFRQFRIDFSNFPRVTLRFQQFRTNWSISGRLQQFSPCNLMISTISGPIGPISGRLQQFSLCNLVKHAMSTIFGLYRGCLPRGGRGSGWWGLGGDGGREIQWTNNEKYRENAAFIICSYFLLCFPQFSYSLTVVSSKGFSFWFKEGNAQKHRSNMYVKKIQLS